MNQNTGSIREWRNVTKTIFREEILPSYQPAILRSLVNDWPVVDAGRKGSESIFHYFLSHDTGIDVNTIMVKPEYNGLQSYADSSLEKFTCVRNNVPIGRVVEQLTRYAQFEHPPSVAIQGAPIKQCMPRFLQENRLDILDDTIQPQLWLGNRFTVPTHCDEMSNIACVVAGRRRFTLFPPEQINNLYIGPLEYSPAGPPVSLVSLKNPDFDHYPKFKNALESAQTAVLEPGDAVFIPAYWWHNVESLEKVNSLINYWWHENTAEYPTRPTAECLYHCLLNMKHLPPAHREAVGAFFNYYLFNSKEIPNAHIPETKRGILGNINSDLAQRIKEFLVRGLS